MPDDHSHLACLSRAENDGNGPEDKYSGDETTQKTVNEANNGTNEASVVNERLEMEHFKPRLLRSSASCQH